MIVIKTHGKTAQTGCLIGVSNDAIAPLPQSLIGVIEPTPTTGRPNPPDPICGFPCDGTPFGKGHIMALELGGPDIPENVVPQFGQWQQTGEWRSAETAIRDSVGGDASHLLVIKMVYGNNGNFFSATKNKFSDGQKLTQWDDFRIPTEFRIWVVCATSPTGEQMRELFDKSEAEQSKWLSNPQHHLTHEPEKYHFTVQNMPNEDRKYWRGQMIRKHIKDEFKKYETDYQEKYDDIVSKHKRGAKDQALKEAGIGAKRQKIGEWVDDNLPKLVESQPKLDWTIAEMMELDVNQMSQAFWA